MKPTCETADLVLAALKRAYEQFKDKPYITNSDNEVLKEMKRAIAKAKTP